MVSSSPAASGSPHSKRASINSLSATPKGHSRLKSLPGTPYRDWKENVAGNVLPKTGIPWAESRLDSSGHKRVQSASSISLDCLNFSSNSGTTSPILEETTNGAIGQRTLLSSLDGQKALQEIKKSRTVNFQRQSLPSAYAHHEDRRQSDKSLSQEVQDDESPTKKRRTVERTDEDDAYSLFVSADSDSDETSMFVRADSDDGQDVRMTFESQVAIKHEDDDEESLNIYQTYGGDDEEMMGIFLSDNEYVDVKPVKRTKAISQAPKIMKKGIARRVKEKSLATAEEKRFSRDLEKWAAEERDRKVKIGSLEPKRIYEEVKEIMHIDEEQADGAIYDATQVTTMILSLGSTQGIVELKLIMAEIRRTTGTTVRYPVKFGTRESILRLTRWVRKYEHGIARTQFGMFQMRYYMARFCTYVARKRAKLVQREARENRYVTDEDAERQICAALIARAYPEIQRYEKREGVARMETEEFAEAADELDAKSRRGYCWSALQGIFGIGILALYYHSKLFSVTARVSLDDKDMPGDEANILIKYLSPPENAHHQWLKKLCSKINAHLERGVTGQLYLPELFVERWDIKEIEKCQEQSDLLAMMCGTLKRTSKQPGNKVTEAAWTAVGPDTCIRAWVEKVESKVYG